MLGPQAAAGTLATGNLVIVSVRYRLEVDELTAFTNDLRAYADDIDAFQFRGRPLRLYSELMRHLSPDLAFRLSAKANGQRLEFQCTRFQPTLHDEYRTPLGHLRCDFEFMACFVPRAGIDNELTFRDGTYLGDDGKIDVSLVNDAGFKIASLTAPDEALKKRSVLEREAGDDERLRTVRVAFSPIAVAASPIAPPTSVAEQAAPPSHDDHVLLHLLLHADYGFWLTMLMACVFGAAHALTPGHGKTLVAAYLVGERGTLWHAVVLGLVTTLTHTGIVILIAVILFNLPDQSRTSFGRFIQDGLGLLMGLIVVCMGFWLLLQRLAGRADHVHIGGAHHHHHHGHPAPERSSESPSNVQWWGLVVLGVTGGLVPCWDAIYLLLYAVGRGQVLLALPAVLAFSTGLAAVLVLVGVLVVQVPNFARSRWGNGKIVRALPIVSAVVVTLMGVWMCYEGVQGR
jgi:ABC-type nickel/cobalt efflux system permease component RcnA